MIKDYELKKTIIDQKIDQELRALSFQMYKDYAFKTFGVIYETSLKIPYHIARKMYLEYPRNVRRVAHNLDVAYYRRKKKLQDVIKTMLEKNECTFLTLTFTDNVLNSTNETTRRKYITRYLKSQYSDYVANIDFGSKNEREHYHAVIIGRVDLKKWSYGAINAKTIKNKNNIALAKYISKITNHALKGSNKQQRVIYSRWSEKIAFKNWLKKIDHVIIKSLGHLTTYTIPRPVKIAQVITAKQLIT